MSRSMIPATESCRKDAGKSPYLSGKHRRSLEYESRTPSVSWSDFSRWIPTNFLCFPAGTGLKALEKIRKISGRNTGSTKSPELLGTDRFRAGLFDLGDDNKNFRRAKSSEAFAITTTATNTTNCCFTYFNS